MLGMHSEREGEREVRRILPAHKRAQWSGTGYANTWKSHVSSAFVWPGHEINDMIIWWELRDSEERAGKESHLPPLLVRARPIHLLSSVCLCSAPSSTLVRVSSWTRVCKERQYGAPALIRHPLRLQLTLAPSVSRSSLYHSRSSPTSSPLELVQILHRFPCSNGKPYADN